LSSDIVSVPVVVVSGYQYQRHYVKKLQRPRKSRVVAGKKALSHAGATGFKGAPEPDRNLFIYRVEKDTTEEDIEQYLVDNDISYRSISCMSNPNSKYKSFKLTVAVSHFSQLFDDSLWPNGVRVRPFRPPNTSRVNDQNTM